MSKYILAIDSFKGCLTSDEAECAAAQAIESMDCQSEIIRMRMSDGGDGMLEAFSLAIDATIVEVCCHDALMRPIKAHYGIKGNKAIVESAQSCGLNLLGKDVLCPLVATTYGVGEIIIDAISKGCDNFIIGLGGSATSDCGIGMLKALIDYYGESVWDNVKDRFANIKFTIASDVKNPLYGPNGAAYVFAAQKGADKGQIEILDRKAKMFADMTARHVGYDKSKFEGSGAAGGLGYAFMQFLAAEMYSGADMLLDMLDFENKILGAKCVITGEGQADKQTLMGKLPFVVMRRAKALGIPTWLIAGHINDDKLLGEHGFSKVICINDINSQNEDYLDSEYARCRITTTISHLLK